MTKREIRTIKAKAKGRKNRRLADGEFARIMAQINKAEIEDPSIIMGEDISTSVFMPKMVPCKNKHLIPKKLQPADRLWLKKAMEKKMGKNSTQKSHKNNYRMPNKQFKSMMKKASEILGLNNKKQLPIMDLSKKPESDPNSIIDLVLSCVWIKNQDAYRECEKIFKNGNFDFKDKINIINYFYYDKKTTKPFCLIDEKIRTNVIRKIVKTKGDIKIRPFRMVPNEEYFLELQNKPRKKKDYFDKLSEEKKIEWARYANLILNIDKVNLHEIKIRNSFDSENAMFAMRYACKMVKIPEFRGEFGNAYWVLLRVNKYYMRMFEKEYNVYYDMVLDYLNINNKRKTIPIIDAKNAVEKLVPTMKKYGVYKKFLDDSCQIKYNPRNYLKIAKELLLNKI